MESPSSSVQYYAQFAYIPLTYDSQYAGREDLQKDITYYSDLATEAGGRVLEVGCGTGRVLLPIRRSGIDIWGVDLSEGMLGVLRKKAESEGLECKLTLGDLRQFTLKRKFRLIILPFRVFQHMLTVEDQIRALENCRDHLLPGGRLALNIFNPDIKRMTTRVGQPVYEGSFVHPEHGRTVHQWASTKPDWDHQIIRNQMIFHEVDDHGKVLEKHIIPLNMRWTYRYEFEHLAARTGYSVEALHGDFDKARFSADSQEQVWVLQK